MISTQNFSSQMHLAKASNPTSSNSIYLRKNEANTPTPQAEPLSLNEKRMRSEHLIKNFTELIKSSSSSDIEKIQISLNCIAETQSSQQKRSDLLYCYQCFSIELLGKMITCSNEHCKKRFCLNCFKTYHVNHLDKINFNLTNGNWICFDCMMSQREDNTIKKMTVKEPIYNIKEKGLEYKGREDVVGQCENYYRDKANGDDFCKKKCRLCKVKMFHINELLHFSSIENFLGYVDHLLTTQKAFICYNKEALRKNREDIRNYIGKVEGYNKEWSFSYSKPLCKGCLIKLLNQKDCISIMRNVLKDPDEYNVNKPPNKLIDTEDTYINPDYSVNSCSLMPTNKAILSAEHNSQKPIELFRQVIEPFQPNIALQLLHLHNWEKELSQFSQEVNSQSLSIQRAVEKLSKGAKLFNSLFKKSLIEPKDFDEYFNKILAINKRNNEKRSIILSTFAKHQQYLSSLKDYGNSLITSSKSQCLKVKPILSQLEEEFNEYDTLVIGLTQALTTLNSLTNEYITSLKQQLKLTDRFNHLN